jgi:hypothetical protein
VDEAKPSLPKTHTFFEASNKSRFLKWQSPMSGDVRDPHKQVPMNPLEWFVLGIRLFGVWLLTKGVAYFASFIDLRFGLTGTSGDTNPNSYLYYAACDFALAAYFLLGGATFGWIL